MRTIKLEDTCLETLTRLEKLHYETVTKERIIGIALTSPQLNSFNLDSFYQDYLDTYTDYDKCKQEFFEKYVATHVDNYNSTWEVNFFNGVVTIYD